MTDAVFSILAAKTKTSAYHLLYLFYSKGTTGLSALRLCKPTPEVDTLRLSSHVILGNCSPMALRDLPELSLRLPESRHLTKKLDGQHEEIEMMPSVARLLYFN